ncbi:hypothetical protein [uncultured Planococcus sp.]|uniref:phage tail assembly chaperone n=1 Tax=uncultured Planococcus sp. TaxID=337815 RepID=UPI0026215AFB|nr:hypothetical protein [uncultured Planococcus sp.]
MTNKPNALDALLTAELETVETVHIKRLGVDFTVKAITSDELNKINEQSKGPNGKVNESEINGLLVAAACIDPSFKDAGLRERYDAVTAADVVNKALLAGEVVKLTQTIMEISGFSDDTTKIKN